MELIQDNQKIFGALDNTADEIAQEVIKDMAYYILSKSGTTEMVSGTRLISKEIIPKELEIQKDFESNVHLKNKEGVMKNAILFAKHEEKKSKTNSTQASHVLTNRTTSCARPNLTSGIGRDRVECE